MKEGKKNSLSLKTVPNFSEEEFLYKVRRVQDKIVERTSSGSLLNAPRNYENVSRFKVEILMAECKA